MREDFSFGAVCFSKPCGPERLQLVDRCLRPPLVSRGCFLVESIPAVKRCGFIFLP